MARLYPFLEFKKAWLIIPFLLLTIFIASSNSQASSITASIGKPYRGSLENGIPFPSQFEGYTLRHVDRTYATPELIGAMLDAIEGVRQEFPGTCDIYLGDFSNPGGGPMFRHRSHQNGRDVDIGFYARGNRPLRSFIPMNRENLDVPKTWALMENILQSQRVQYIFIDQSIQNLLKDYALSQGGDPAYLDRLFSRTGIIRHIPNHRDHAHVRFFAPWSTMAAKVSASDEQKRKVIAMAQQAYLPKRVNYYVTGNEKNLAALARSFGVTTRDLSRWNNISGHDILTPGTVLAFYKRGFEIEHVHLAQSLRPDSVPEVAPSRLAALRSTRTVSDAPPPRGVTAERNRPQQPSVHNYTVRRGDTLYGIARAHGTSVKALRDLNGLKENSILRAGDKIKVARGNSAPTATPRTASNPTQKYKVVQGDTLYSISQRYGLTVAELARINSLGNNTVLRIGQELVVSKR